MLRGESECELEAEAREGPGRSPGSSGMPMVLEYSALMSAGSEGRLCPSILQRAAGLWGTHHTLSCAPSS